jgi:cinnamoyl-CoA reductase
MSRYLHDNPRVVQSVVHACHGVFHTASPVTDNPVSNSLFSTCKFYRLEQSIWTQIRVVCCGYESCWSDLEYCKNTKV